MAKLPNLKLSEYFIQYMRYKWEFLRRNNEYIRDWEKLPRWPQDTESSITKACIWDDAARKFINKWKILEPTNPSATFDELISCTDMRYNFERLNPKRHGIRAMMEVGAWKFEMDNKTIRMTINKHISETGELTIKLDLNYSKNRLVNEFKSFIDDWKRLYAHGHKELLEKRFLREKYIDESAYSEELRNEFEDAYQEELKQRNKKYHNKYHFDNFDAYLQVYDLREEGKSWSEIKTALDLNSIQTARNHFKAAREIIEKGIDLYVK